MGLPRKDTGLPLFWDPTVLFQRRRVLWPPALNHVGKAFLFSPTLLQSHTHPRGNSSTSISILGPLFLSHWRFWLSHESKVLSASINLFFILDSWNFTWILFPSQWPRISFWTRMGWLWFSALIWSLQHSSRCIVPEQDTVTWELPTSSASPEGFGPAPRTNACWSSMPPVNV